MTPSFVRKDLAPGITLFRGHIAGGRLTFNAYLIRGRESALLHTGPVQTWEPLKQAIREVLPLDTLAYVIVPHFEADECGALSLLLREASPLAVASIVGARQLEGFGLATAVRAAQDGEFLELGPQHTLEFIGVPSEMHLWDGLMVYHRQSQTLFSNDFMAQMGPNVGIDEEEVPWRAMADMQAGNVPCFAPFQGTLSRLAQLSVRTIAPGHGSVIQTTPQEVMRRYFTTRW